MSDELWCPRRNESPRAWPGPDTWDTDRWFRPEDPAYAAYLARRAPDGLHYSATDRQWLDPGAVPQTCSYCGSIAPADALRLLEAGWEVEVTGKWYKRYLNPQGTAAHRQAVLTALRTHTPLPVVAAYWMPTPPVKVYVPHLTDAEIAQWNALIYARPAHAR